MITHRGGVRKPIARPFEWVTYEEYDHHNGLVRGLGAPAWRRFDSMPDLPDDLSAVMDLDAALKFVRVYGFLGRQQILRRGFSEANSSPGDIVILEGHDAAPKLPRTNEFEQLDWILAHARTIRAIRSASLALRRFRESGRRSELSKFEEIWTKGPFAIAASVASVEVPETAKSAPEVFWARVHSDPNLFNAVLQAYVNGNLKGIHPHVETTIEGDLLTDWHIPTLVEKAYWVEWQNQVQGIIRLCPECGTVFRQKESRERYCSRKCSLRLSQRTFREKHKAHSRRGRKKP
jgi:hypothetical protein